MALDNNNGQFPDGSVESIGTSASSFTVPDGASLVYAQTKHASAVVTFDPTGGGNLQLSVSSSSPSLVWTGAPFGGLRSFKMISDTANTPVHLVLYSDRP